MIPSQVTDNWITILFVFLLAIIVILEALFPLKFKDFMAFFKREQYFVKYKKTFVVMDLFFLLFSFFSILVYGFIIFKVKLFYNEKAKINSILLYSQLIGITFWFIIIRFFIGRISSKIFKITAFQESILFYKWIYLSKNALLLFPFLVVFHYYNQSFAYVVLAIITSIILIYNYFVLLAKNQKVIFKHLFYFILYLCTLEIAPLIIYFYIVLKV